MAEHELKTEAPYFDAIARGEKTFEARLNDRGFQKGDTLVLRRLLPASYGAAAYDTLAEPLRFTVGWILSGGHYGVQPGWCVMSLLPSPERTGSRASAGQTEGG